MTINYVSTVFTCHNRPPYTPAQISTNVYPTAVDRHFVTG